MKKAKALSKNKFDDIRPEYDISKLKGLVRGKYFARYREPASEVPVVIPDLLKVKSFAMQLHAKKEVWRGVMFGWDAEYNPQRKGRPLDSKMTFTPADFCIGESGIWFFSLMWERGEKFEPIEFLDDRNLLQAGH